MLFSPRIKLKPLAGLCRRLSVSLAAGLDVRTVWTREAGQDSSGNLRTIAEAVGRGESLTEALAETGSYFPVLFREMTVVGEQSGRLSEVFAQLAEHYQNQLEMRRVFLTAIAWPMVELGAALFIVGCFIAALGFIESMTGTRIDPLGLGLVGLPGVMIYLALLSAVAAAFYFVLQAMRRGLAWTRPIQHGIMRIPVLGKVLQTLALSRLAWSMYVTLGAGMEVRRSLRLSLNSTRHTQYTDQIESIDAEIINGNSIYDTFVQAGCFPQDFLDMLATGEQSGKLEESMQRLSAQYQDQARAALKTLSVLGGFAIWALVALLIVLLIFKLAFFYIGTIQDLAAP